MPSVSSSISPFACRSATPGHYIRGHGRKKVLFGSNFPMITPGECLEGVGELGLPAEARGLFLGGNARRVYRIG